MTFTVVIPFVYFTDDEQEANWIFAQFGRSRADKSSRVVSNFFGKQLACDCGQLKCHAAVLDELKCELVTSGAITNEEWKFSTAPSGRNSIPDNSMLPQHLRQVGTWPGRWIPISIQISTCTTLCFFAVTVGLLSPFYTAILVKLAQSQQRVKGY